MYLCKILVSSERHPLLPNYLKLHTDEKSNSIYPYRYCHRSTLGSTNL